LKRHVLTDLDTLLVPAVGVTAANVPEAEVADQIKDDLDAQNLTLGELGIDRAYLSSSLVRDRPDDLQVFRKAFPVRNRPPLCQDRLPHRLRPGPADLPTTSPWRLSRPG
jgi:hypothetical protein